MMLRPIWNIDNSRWERRCWGCGLPSGLEDGVSMQELAICGACDAASKKPKMAQIIWNVDKDRWEWSCGICGFSSGHAARPLFFTPEYVVCKSCSDTGKNPKPKAGCITNSIKNSIVGNKRFGRA